MSLHLSKCHIVGDTCHGSFQTIYISQCGLPMLSDSTIKTAASASIAQDSTVISENISTARDDSYARSIKESPRLQTASIESSPDEIHKRMMNDKSNLKNHNRSGSESSVIEDIQSQSSESKK